MTEHDAAAAQMRFDLLSVAIARFGSGDLDEILLAAERMAAFVLGGAAPPSLLIPPAVKRKRRGPQTDEQRLAQSERMKRLHAEGRMGRKPAAAAEPEPSPTAMRPIPSSPLADRKPAAASPSSRLPTKPADTDQAAIDKFLAEKGARLVMSPEQVAAFLRDAGHEAAIREVGQGSGPTFKYVTQAMLDGNPVGLDALYAAANKLREAAGLKSVSPAEPPKSAAA